jgi:deoxyribonuclease-4
VFLYVTWCTFVVKSLSFKFGTVGSPAATPPRPGGTVGGINYAASIGLDALEMAWVNGVRVGEPTCAAIKLAGEETGMALSVHAPYYITEMRRNGRACAPT